MVNHKGTWQMGKSLGPRGSMKGDSSVTPEMVTKPGTGRDKGGLREKNTKALWHAHISYEQVIAHVSPQPLFLCSCSFC